MCENLTRKGWDASAQEIPATCILGECGTRGSRPYRDMHIVAITHILIIGGCVETERATFELCVRDIKSQPAPMRKEVRGRSFVSRTDTLKLSLSVCLAYGG